jgi:arylsulfatase A-like enzyme
VDTSNIDALAKDGVQFDRAYCQSPVCTPSRASFLTGRYPRTTKVRQNGQAIPKSEVLVTRRLADEGYTCGLSGKLHIAPSDPAHTEEVAKMERRIDDGYADFHWSHDPRETVRDAYWPTNEYHQWLHQKGVAYEPEDFDEKGLVQTSTAPEHHQTTWCAEKAISFIEQAQQAVEPWAFSVNIFDPHVPFDPPEEYLERYLDRLDEIPLPNHTEGERRDKPLYQSYPPSIRRIPFDEMDEEDHRLIRAAYWAMVDLIDDQVGRILNSLERTGQRENTLVIFMSDHGEMLGDHGFYLKGPFFYEPAVRVPLVVSWPGQVEAGRTSEALVELTDIAPTILDAFDISHPPGMQGRSLWPLLYADAPLNEHRESIYAEYYHALEREQFYTWLQDDEYLGGEDDVNPDFHEHLGPQDVFPPYHSDFDETDHVLPYATMVRTDQYKLVRFHSEDSGELYDLETDPNETDNLYRDKEYSDVKAELLEELSDRMAQTVDPLPARQGRF